MARTMASHEARANFGDLISSVYYTGEPVVIARKGRPMAVLVAPADFERWQALEGQRANDPNWTFKMQRAIARQSGESRALITPAAPEE